MKLKNLTVIVILSAVAIFSLAVNNCICDADTRNIFIGIFSSSVVVLIIELISFLRDWLKYSTLRGTYKRRVITNRLDQRTPDSIYEDMTAKYNQININPTIELKYKGEGEYAGIVYYEEGTAKITINLNQDNPNTGTGTYQYIEKKPGYKMPDLGTYKVQVDMTNNKIIYIYYSNVLQNGLASGYEIWEK